MDNFPLMQPRTAMPQKGDLNGDNEIASADVSDDDRVTSLDALMILQSAAGAIEL